MTKEEQNNIVHRDWQMTIADETENAEIAKERDRMRSNFERNNCSIRLKSGAPIIGMHIADVTGDSRPHRAKDLIKTYGGAALGLVLLYLFAVFGLAL